MLSEPNINLLSLSIFVHVNVCILQNADQDLRYITTYERALRWRKDVLILA